LYGNRFCHFPPNNIAFLTRGNYQPAPIVICNDGDTVSDSQFHGQQTNLHFLFAAQRLDGELFALFGVSKGNNCFRSSAHFPQMP